MGKKWPEDWVMKALWRLCTLPINGLGPIIGLAIEKTETGAAVTLQFDGPNESIEIDGTGATHADALQDMIEQFDAKMLQLGRCDTQPAPAPEVDPS